MFSQLKKEHKLIKLLREVKPSKAYSCTLLDDILTCRKGADYVSVTTGSGMFVRNIGEVLHESIDKYGADTQITGVLVFMKRK